MLRIIKKLTNKIATWGLGASVAIAFFTSCKPDTAVVEPPVVVPDYTKVMFHHFAPEAGGLSLTVDGKPITIDSLAYLSNTVYQQQLAGRRAIRVIQGSNIVLNDSLAMNKDINYSIFLYRDTAAGQPIRHIFTSDVLSLPAVGKGKVRLIHLIPDAAIPAVDVEAVPAGGIASNNATFGAVQFKNLKDFVELNAGNYDFLLKLPNSQSVLFRVQNVPISDGKIYTLVARGLIQRANMSGFTVVSHN
jgi:hypothetical protein